MRAVGSRCVDAPRAWHRLHARCKRRDSLSIAPSRRSRTRRAGIIRALLGQDAERVRCAREPPFGPRRPGCQGRPPRRRCLVRATSSRRSERLGVVSAVAEHDFRCCFRRPAGPCSRALVMCVCCAGYITPVTERSPGGLTPAKHATIGRVARPPSRRLRTRSTGLSGRVTPATTSRPVMDHRGPSSPPLRPTTLASDAGAGAPWIDEVVGRVAHALRST